MKKAVFYSLTFLLSLIVFTSFITNDWFVLQRDNYKILFPGSPSIDSTINETKIGQLLVYNYMYESPEADADSNLVYGFSVTAYPEKYVMSTQQSYLNGLFDGMVNGAVKNINGKLISQKEIEYKTYPGREIKIDYGEGSAVVTMKMILVQNRAFALQTISLFGKENNSNATKFFGSIDIK